MINDSSTPLDVLVFSALTLGLVYVGSCCEDVAQLIIFAIMERSEVELNDPLIRFLPLALGLLYLGKQVIYVLVVQWCFKLLWNFIHGSFTGKR